MPNNCFTFDNEPHKKRIIYFDRVCGMWSFQPDSIDFPLEFDSYAQLVHHCLKAYGEEIEFYEVTPENWQRLYDSGAFD
ncbi:hypothetical protein [Paraglaciecola marina]|uniref:hypothetical protein n=1 Tax=Paraglaciecola marina TaxID=2500157 RepID=UPI00105D8057|nr:hypothetical protein [Paraglaciecola marina]